MDPVRTEIMRNRFAAIVSEASYVAYRCAHTTFVREVQDYQVSIAGLSGEYFAWPTESGISTSTTQSVKALVDIFGADNLNEGDILISNDPFSAGALVTHIMDINLLMPIFYKGKLISYAWAFIHASDVGGSVPGSVDPTNDEVYQEGVRITPTYLYRKGELNELLWQIFRDNTRIPELIWGDLQAMIAGMNLLKTRMHEICERYGVDDTLQSIEDVLTLADQKAQAAVRATLREGVYESNDYLESYEENQHIFIKCKMTVNDGKITLDFSGSDPQVNYAMNFPSSDGDPHSHLCALIMQYIRSVEPTVPVNCGMLRSVRTKAPKGSICNAQFPAAGGNRAITICRCYDAVLACLNQAIERGFAAAGAGSVGVMSVSSINRKTGRRQVSVVQPFLGGGGGRKGIDGTNGSHAGFGYLKSVPVETVELETPLIFRYYGYEKDTAAPGEFRGGASMRIDYENRGTPAIVTCRGLDRFRFQPWGIEGGKAGAKARILLNPGRDNERDIGKIDVLHLQPGDVVRMISPSGGGYGNPAHRAVDKVVNDVVNGIVSVERALQDYGVEVSGTGRTMTGKRVKAAISSCDQSFSIGPERSRIESVWSPEVSAVLATELLQCPVALRSYWLWTLRQRLSVKASQVTVEEVRAELDNLRRLAA